MVSSQQFAILPSPNDEHIRPRLDALTSQFLPAEGEIIRQATQFAASLYAGQTEVTGMSLLEHALGAAAILASMKMDHETITSAILHAAPAYLAAGDQTLPDRFGAAIATLVDGISRMEQIREFSELQSAHEKPGKKSDDAQQMESLRKMLLAMAEDIRVVLIKLAERTQTMRTLSGANAEIQRAIARETQSIFAPLANRLGVWQLKWELEDLSLRYLEPELYKQVARLLDERRADREQYIADVVTQLRAELDRAGIQAEVVGRPKHIYSIINKMRRKGLEFGELYDVRAVRILVADIKDCYAALGLVHNLWQPIPGEFDDYIARPKSNEYRSLHTAVTGPRGLALEVQIRTHEMHRHSELGVAAHWRYKEGGKTDARLDAQIAWLRRILEWKDEMAARGDMLEQFKNELFQQRIYVLTPQGKVIDLPHGATPVDFAYAVHTGLGHRTRGAKVNGSIVPLNYRLQTGQRVEILAAKQGAPSRDWLNPALGYLQSPRARAKVRHWFNEQNFDHDVAQGRAQMDRELHRAGGVAVNQEQVAHRLHFGKLDELLAAVGRGEITQRQLSHAIQQEAPAKPAEVALPTPPARHVAPHPSGTGILVEGVGNLQTKMARCCNPVPPEPIVGYVTLDHRITIHRRNCAFVRRVPEDRQERLLDAQWGSRKGTAFAAEIEVEAEDRQGLLRDLGDLFVRQKVNVVKVDSLSKYNQARMRFAIEIADLEEVGRLLVLARQVPGVISARRL